MSPEPLAGTVSLLLCGIDDPLLGLGIDNLSSHFIEPPTRQLRVAYATPELSDEVRQHSTLVPGNPIERVEGLLELPRRLSPEEPLSLDIPFIDTAPSGSKQQIGDVPWLEGLPFGDLGRGLVLLGPSQVAAGDGWGKLVPDVLLESRRDVNLFGEVALGTRVPTTVARVDQVR